MSPRDVIMKTVTQVIPIQDLINIICDYLPMVYKISLDDGDLSFEGEYIPFTDSLIVRCSLDDKLSDGSPKKLPYMEDFCQVEYTENPSPEVRVETTFVLRKSHRESRERFLEKLIESFSGAKDFGMLDDHVALTVDGYTILWETSSDFVGIKDMALLLEAFLSSLRKHPTMVNKSKLV